MGAVSQALNLLGQPGWSAALLSDPSEAQGLVAELLAEGADRARARVWEGEALLLEAWLPRIGCERRLRSEMEPSGGAWEEEARVSGLSELGARARCASLLIQALRPMRISRVELLGPAPGPGRGLGA